MQQTETLNEMIFPLPFRHQVSLPEKSRYARHVFERLLSDIRRKAEDRERGPVNYMAFP